MYDIIIIGAGPAGLTAAIYARRAEKSVLVIEKESFGGQITKSPRVENYPGSRSISGAELGDMLFEHATDLGAEIELDTVIGIKGETADLTVICEGGEHRAKAVIIATGSEHRELDLGGADKLTGKGISYCAVCDGAFYKGKKVVVIGGGNTALQEAIMLSDIASEVVILQDLPLLTGEKSLQNVIAEKENVRVVTGARVSWLETDEGGRLTGLVYEEIDGKFMLAADGIFVAIGQVPKLDQFADVIELDERGYAAAGEDCIPKSTVEGIYVAGDCRTKKIRQVTTATADGAVAALAAINFIDNLWRRRKY